MTAEIFLLCMWLDQDGRFASFGGTVGIRLVACALDKHFLESACMSDRVDLPEIRLDVSVWGWEWIAVH